LRDNGINTFHIVDFPQRFARNLDATSVRRLLSRSRCKFLIYGVGRIRRQENQEVHVFDLTGVVSHAPIPKSVSTRFAEEFTSLFPTKLLVPIENDFFSFEVTAYWLDVVVRYIVGVAAYYTRDLAYAEELLLSVEQRLNRDEPRVPAITRIKQSVPGRLRDVYKAGAYGWGDAYRIERDKVMLRNAELALDKLDARFPTDYNGHILRAMIAFALHRDIERAKREIDKCRAVNDSTWMYSDAFLHAYEGDLESAYRIYRKAFEYPSTDMTLAIQVEEFIQIVIDEEPDRVDLYFCLGLLNYRAKFDLEAARKDFGRFLNGTERSHYPRQHEAVEKWMGEINRAFDLRNSK